MRKLEARDLVFARVKVSTELTSKRTRSGAQDPPNCSLWSRVKDTAVSRKLRTIPSRVAVLPGWSFTPRMVIRKTRSSRARDARSRERAEKREATSDHARKIKPGRITRAASAEPLVTERTTKTT